MEGERMSIQPMTLTKHDDGSVTADDFPEQIAVTPEVVDQHDDRWMRFDGDDLVLTLSNGTARYRYIGPHFNGTRAYKRLADGGVVRPEPRLVGE
jgi:hypothetical protein